MNRRNFMAITSISLVALLVGCNSKPANQNFIGYWRTDNGNYPPTLIEIKQNEGSLIFTVNAWNNIGKVGYKTYSAPAKPDNDAKNILIVANTKHVTYNQNKDQIISDGQSATRITKSKYEIELARK